MERSSAISDPAALGQASSIATSPSAVTSAAASITPTATTLVETVVQIKRRRLHVKLTATEVGIELRRLEGWEQVNDRQLRTANEKANKQLGFTGTAADIYSWRCTVDRYHGDQLAEMLIVAGDEDRMHKAAIDAPADAGSKLEAVFVFASNWTARRLCMNVRRERRTLPIGAHVHLVKR